MALCPWLWLFEAYLFIQFFNYKIDKIYFYEDEKIPPNQLNIVFFIEAYSPNSSPFISCINVILSSAWLKRCNWDKKQNPNKYSISKVLLAGEDWDKQRIFTVELLGKQTNLEHSHFGRFVASPSEVYIRAHGRPTPSGPAKICNQDHSCFIMSGVDLDDSWSGLSLMLKTRESINF